MRRRPGVTLIEVLVTIFIMTIGMLALLTLFPLGAVSMGQALKDDRCITSVQIATGFADSCNGTGWTGLRNDPQVTQYLGMTMNNPPAGFTNLSTVQGGYTGPSYPVYVDPYYATALPIMGANTLSSPNTPGIPRCTPSAPMGNNPGRYFSLLDDITFTTNGTPDTSSGSVARGGVWTWAYMLQQPVYNSTPNTPTNMWVVVYRGRPVLAPIAESSYAVVTLPGTPGAIAGGSGLTIGWMPGPQQKPAIRRGVWILDNSLPAPTPPNTVSVPNANFYRVVNVVDTGVDQQTGLTTLSVEVQPPLVAGVTSVVVMDNAVEVFFKSTTN